MSKLKVGDPLPDFNLPDQDGNRVSPKDFKGKKNLVIYFYPGDFTYGCTKEACAFQDRIDAIEAADAVLIGISKDSQDSHSRFAEELGLDYTLLSDEDGKVRKQFGVGKLLGILGDRITYVADRRGIIRHIFSSRVNFSKHVSEALKTLKKI